MVISQLFDIAIGMMFVYLSISLICSGINEWIAHLLDSRARYLEEWLNNLLKGSDPQGKALIDTFKNHPLIKALVPAVPRPLSKAPAISLPPYITPRTFLLALLDTVAPVNLAAGKRTLDDIRASLDKLPDTDLKKTLLALLDSAGNDIEQVRQNIEEWFNDAMERLSGVYKRRTRIVILSLSLLVTVALNVDTLRVFGTLYRDSAVRAAVATAAQQTVQQSDATAQPSSSTFAATDPPSSLTKVKQIQTELQSLDLPIGWSGSKAVPPSNDILGWVLTVLGWLITTLAASQGAPFWFDALNKLVNVRTTGVRPPTAPGSTSSQDRRIIIQPAQLPDGQPQSDPLGILQFRNQ